MTRNQRPVTSIKIDPYLCLSMPQNLQIRNTFKKEERLCSKIELDALFKKGKSVFVYPFKFIFMESGQESDYPVKVVFSVPKRSFKLAVTRNLLRRRMKEAYRLNKVEFYDAIQMQNKNISLMIIYTHKDEMDYSKIEKGMVKGMRKLLKKLED